MSHNYYDLLFINLLYALQHIIVYIYIAFITYFTL